MKALKIEISFLLSLSSDVLVDKIMFYIIFALIYVMVFSQQIITVQTWANRVVAKMVHLRSGVSQCLKSVKWRSKYGDELVVKQKRKNLKLSINCEEKVTVDWES